MAAKLHNGWVTVERAPDIPGVWVSHFLDFGVVSQGDSLAHALTMLREAVEIIIADDHASGLDSFDRRAPREDWDELWAMLRQATPTDWTQIVEHEDKIGVLLAQFEVAVELPTDADEKPVIGWEPRMTWSEDRAAA